MGDRLCGQPLRRLSSPIPPALLFWERFLFPVALSTSLALLFYVVIVISLPIGNIVDHVTILIYTWLFSVQIAFTFFFLKCCLLGNSNITWNYKTAFEVPSSPQILPVMVWRGDVS